MNNDKLFKEIDNYFIKTKEKYNKEQLLGAIINFLTKEDVSAFSDKNSREAIKKIGSANLKKALILNVVKTDANVGIKDLRKIDNFGKNYDKHTVGETELRIIQTLLLSNDDKFKLNAVKEVEYMMMHEPNTLINIIKSFIENRYMKSSKKVIDKDIYNLEYLDVIDNINKYYEKNEIFV